MITRRAAQWRLRRLFVGLFVEDDDARHLRRRPTPLDQLLVEPNVRGAGGSDVVRDSPRTSSARSSTFLKRMHPLPMSWSFAHWRRDSLTPFRSWLTVFFPRPSVQRQRMLHLRKLSLILLLVSVAVPSLLAATPFFGPKTYVLATGAPATFSEDIGYDAVQQGCDGKA